MPKLLASESTNAMVARIAPAVLTLLTEAYAPAEKAKTQGLNDFIVFAVMAISSFSSGTLINAAGWERMNALTLPFVAVVMLAASLLMLRRRGASRVPARSKVT